MKKKKRWIVLLIIGLLLTGFLFACKKGEKSRQANGKEEGNNRVILTVGDREVTYQEVMFYVLCIKEQYEDYFGKEIWSVKFGKDKTFEDMCKEDVLNEIIQLKVITSQAEEEGVFVTEDEADEIADTVREQLEEITKEDAATYGITTDLLKSIYHDNYLSSKMFDVVTGEVDTNVLEEEARRGVFQVLVVLTNGEDKNGEQVLLSESEKTEAYKKAKKLLKKAKESEDFYSFALSYSDREQVEYTVGRGVMGDTFDEEAFLLQAGEFGPVVEGKDGYYIIYCVTPMDEDATAEAKEEIINKRQDEVFRTAYQKWTKEFPVEVNEENWEKITFLD